MPGSRLDRVNVWCWTNCSQEQSFSSCKSFRRIPVSVFISRRTKNDLTLQARKVLRGFREKDPWSPSDIGLFWLKTILVFPWESCNKVLNLQRKTEKIYQAKFFKVFQPLPGIFFSVFLCKFELSLIDCLVLFVVFLFFSHRIPLGKSNKFYLFKALPR